MKLDEMLDGLEGAVTADLTTDLDTPWYKMDDARQILAHAQAFAVADTETVTLQWRQATASDGTGAKNLGTAQAKTAPSGGGDVDFIHGIRAEDLDHQNDFVFVSARLSTTDAVARSASVALLKGDLRHSNDEVIE